MEIIVISLGIVVSPYWRAVWILESSSAEEIDSRLALYTKKFI